MKATITFTDNGDKVDVSVEFEPGAMCKDSDSHQMAAAALSGLARYLAEAEEVGDDE